MPVRGIPLFLAHKTRFTFSHSYTPPGYDVNAPIVYLFIYLPIYLFIHLFIYLFLDLFITSLFIYIYSQGHQLPQKVVRLAKSRQRWLIL